MEKGDRYRGGRPVEVVAGPVLCVNQIRRDRYDFHQRSPREDIAKSGAIHDDKEGLSGAACQESSQESAHAF